MDEFIEVLLPEIGFTDYVKSDVEELFRSFDTDGSGSISFAEVNRMVRAGSLMGGGVPPPRGGKLDAKEGAVIPFTDDDLEALRKETRKDVRTRPSPLSHAA